ncbi:MAG: serine hydrolase domain-containing protein [bacterium]
MPDDRALADSPQTMGLDPDKLEALFSRAEKEVRAGLLPSMQIAVARHGRVVATRTVGRVTYAGRDAAATDDTLYVIFSCTKAIVSAAAWLLIEEGALDIDLRVADLLPEFGTNGKHVVTVEQLFTHTCGFPYAPFSARDWDDPQARRARFGSWRLTWEPGTRFEYHPTASMWVIAALIEHVTGQSFRDVIRTRIAQPLGLDDLWVGLAAAQHHRLADVTHVGEPPSPDALRELGFPTAIPREVAEEALGNFNVAAVREVGIPGGGGTTTASTLALFYQALLGHRRAASGDAVWKPTTVEMARRVRTGELRDAIFGRHANRGLGIVVAGDEERVFRGFGHGGSALAFGHNGAGGQLAWADPDSGMSFVYLTNGCDRHPVRQARRGVALNSLAAAVCDTAKPLS